MAIRQAKAVWQGNLKEGCGMMETDSKTLQGPYSFSSRFGAGEKNCTNPEELIAAAAAGCFSMALAHTLAEAGFPPQKVTTTARVHLAAAGQKFEIGKIELETDASVAGIQPKIFQKYAEDVKKNCPVARALAATRIELKAKLAKESQP